MGFPHRPPDRFARKEGLSWLGLGVAAFGVVEPRQVGVDDCEHLFSQVLVMGSSRLIFGQLE